MKILQKNKKAYFNYEILENLECGIVLVGTEVKSIKAGKFSFKDSYVKIVKNSLILKEFAIQPYSMAANFNHEIDVPRTLLAHKSEIKRLQRKVKEKGFTLIPTLVYLKKNYIKVQVSVCRGKSNYDKKNVIKERDIKKQSQREMRDYFKN